MSLETVQRARAKYSFLSPGPERAHHIVNQVAWDLKSEGAGLLEKKSGSQYNDRSLDVVIYKPGGETYDCLQDAEGIAKPQWTRTKPTGFGDVSKWRAPMPPIAVEPEPEPVPPEPVPPQPTDPTTDPALLAVVASHGREIEALKVLVNALANRIAVLEAATYRVDGSTSRALGHSHTVALPVIRTP